MQRRLLLAAGFIETLLAALLLMIGIYLPSPAALERGFAGIDSLSRTAENQVELVRKRIREARRSDFRGITSQVRSNAVIITQNVQTARINFNSIESMRDALRLTADGLDGLSDNLDPDKCRLTIERLNAIIDMMDTNGPANATRGWHELIAAVQPSLDDRLKQELLFITCRLLIMEFCERCNALHDELSDGSAWLERSLRLKELPGLPAGTRLAEREKGVGSVQRVNHECSVGAHCEGPVWELAQRNGAAFRELLASLSHWPAAAAALKRSAAVLRESERQVQTILLMRDAYDQALQSSSQLARAADQFLQQQFDELDDGLGEQEQALMQMESGLRDLSAALPEAQRSSTTLLIALRWLTSVAGALIGVHGLFSAVALFWKR